MTIELTAYQVRIPLRRPIRHASHRRTETDNVIVRCVLPSGAVGYGEGVPRDYVTGETIEVSIDLLRQANLAAQLQPCTDFAQAVELASRLTLPAVAGDDRGCLGNAARCAVELAILDAHGRQFGQPLSAVTPLVAPEIHSPQDRVRYSGAITSARGWKLRLLAWAYRLYGFPQMKVKVGIEGQDDVNRLKHIRRILGKKTPIRVDANEAWTPADAARKIRELEPFSLSAVEQPVPHEAVATLAELRRQVQTPIMLDESLCSRIDAERAIAGGWCDLFNIRLSKCGGFVRSLELAKLARQAGLGYQLGCQVGETAILSAAGRHFACSVGGIRSLEGSYDKHLVREALGKRDLTFGWGGRAAALPGPGLGVEIDEKALKRVTVRTERLV